MGPSESQSSAASALPDAASVEPSGRGSSPLNNTGTARRKLSRVTPRRLHSVFRAARSVRPCWQFASPAESRSPATKATRCRHEQRIAPLQSIHVVTMAGVRTRPLASLTPLMKREKYPKTCRNGHTSPR